MKSLIWKMLFGFAAVGLFVGRAQAALDDPDMPPYYDRHNYYVAATYGWENALGDVNTNPDQANPGIPSFNLSLDDGYNAHLALGASHGPIRGEFEIGYMHNDVSSIQNNSIPGLTLTDGNVHSLNLMGNGYYDFLITKRFSLFAGGGGGLAFMNMDVSANSGAANYGGNGNTTCLALQGMVGMDLAVTEKLHLTLGYRLFFAFNADVTFVSTPHGSAGTITSNDSLDLPAFQSVEVGLRYEF